MCISSPSCLMGRSSHGKYLIRIFHEARSVMESSNLNLGSYHPSFHWDIKENRCRTLKAWKASCWKEKKTKATTAATTTIKATATRDDKVTILKTVKTVLKRRNQTIAIISQLNNRFWGRKAIYLFAQLRYIWCVIF